MQTVPSVSFSLAPSRPASLHNLSRRLAPFSRPSSPRFCLCPAALCLLFAVSPQLVGTGTAIAAAASGLVFGQPATTSSSATIEDSSPRRTLRRSHRRTISVDHALETARNPTTVVYSRPLTTSAAPSIDDDHSYHRAVSHPQVTSRPPLSRHQRPPSSHITSPRSSSRRLSFARPGELSPSAGPRDSLSSNGSWMRRLSIRPLSQTSSPRSSLIADSISCASPAPIPFRPGPTAPPLAPNKLVKRTPSTQNGSSPAEIYPRWRLRGHLPTLRRPATSHQRSATLQQFRADVDVAGSAAHPKYSFEQPIGPEELLGPSPFSEQFFAGSQPDSGWASFFHFRTTRVPASGSVQVRLGDATFALRELLQRRVCPESGLQKNSVHLVKPSMITASLTPIDVVLAPPAEIQEASDHASSKGLGGLTISPEPALATRTKRSLSESFSSATNWVSKRSSSLRRQKRGFEQSGNPSRRYVSEPTELGASHPDQQEITSPPQPSTKTLAPRNMLQDSALADSVATDGPQLPLHNRNRSSPPSGHSTGTYSVGSLTRPRGFSRGGATTRYTRPNQPSGSSTSSTVLSQFARGSHYERSSVMESSDGDARGFTSGDDDDFDFKSDTMFDSLRTLSSSRARAVETPLESVYDESPPSTVGNGRTKHMSVQEMLARGWDEGNKILEEDDESTPTPVRASPFPGTKQSPSQRNLVAVEPRSDLWSPNDDVARMAKKMERCSVDGLDDDEDWTRDDDEPLSDPLTPLSNCGSSLGSKGMNPNVRLALASIEGGTLPLANDTACRTERPLSNLFEWSETSMYDKHEGDGISMRPRTAYAMPEMDSRGGRSAIRRGPTPTHVRSQSVPVVHDSAVVAKPPGPKYGTWGMAAKAVSEDWDEDFEFGAGGGDCGGEAAGGSQESAFAVPESIRATQPSVRAHSGQIRELSLLVNDLKRLCRHGRELNMLSGDHTGLWREAEGIIALASPDEDDDKEDNYSSAPADPISRDVKGLPLEGKHDATTPDPFDAAFDSPEPTMRKTAVVRERQSPRRRSVFSPEDDIFGGGRPPNEPNGAQPSRVKQPRTPDGRTTSSNDVSGVVRSVMESMRQHHRTPIEPPRESRPHEGINGRVQFDTNSLKALVKRAGELRDVLSDAIRRAEQIMQSPAATPRRERRLDSSPAFTRVFDDPGSSPLRRVTKSRGSNSMMESASSPDKSPSSPISPQMPLMTVG